MWVERKRNAMRSSNANRMWWLIGVCLVVTVLLLLRNLFSAHSTSGSVSTISTGRVAVAQSSHAGPARPFRSSDPVPTRTAEEIVAGRMKQFARSRRDIVRAMARQKGIEIPDVVERYFDALESGDWNAVEATFKILQGKDASGDPSLRLPAVQALWGPIFDAYGAAEQVHLWPAQKLLDYGNAVLGSLRPGMVYVGGTDEGRWVPTLLNDTSDGEQHIVITQNALADATYLEYVRFLYGDRFTAPTTEDSRRAFEDYMADARKRLAHDTEFPDEPKQVRPGEQLKMEDNRFQVSGQVAVMDINERILRAMMEKNPDLSFALQESFPLKGTYADAAPLGPITELRAPDPAAFTPERAAQSVEYWRGVAEQLRTQPDESAELTALKSFSKLAVGQANLFAEHGLVESAEQTYRIAREMLANNTEATTGLAELLVRSGRSDEARALLEQFAREFPKQSGDLKNTAAWTATISAGH